MPILNGIELHCIELYIKASSEEKMTVRDVTRNSFSFKYKIQDYFKKIPPFEYKLIMLLFHSVNRASSVYN